MLTKVKLKRTVYRMEMRRKERCVSNQDDIREFIAKEEVMRIAFQDKEGCYIVPLNYGEEYLDDKLVLYFHGALAGRKAEAFLGENQPAVESVAFEIDGNHEPVVGDGCNLSYKYTSVIGTAHVTILSRLDEKSHALEVISSKIVDRPEGFTFNEAVLAKTLVVRVEVNELACKRH